MGLSARFFAHLLSRCCVEVPLMKALEPSSSPVPFITFVGHTGMPKCLLVLLTFHTHKRNIIHCLLGITLGLFWSWIGLLFLLSTYYSLVFVRLKKWEKEKDARLHSKPSFMSIERAVRHHQQVCLCLYLNVNSDWLQNVNVVEDCMFCRWDPATCASTWWELSVVSTVCFFWSGNSFKVGDKD